MTPVVVIGDALIDAIESDSGATARFPGGAALNLAVGLVRLGGAATLAVRLGMDRRGFWLARYLREEGVSLINTRNADFTGVATSRHQNGVPEYRFAPSLFRRRIAFDTRLLSAIAHAPAVVVNSLSYDVPRQAERLASAFDLCTGLRVLDPNPRPRLIADFVAYRSGFEKAVSRATLVKLSDDDARLLYNRDDDDLSSLFFERGVSVVLFTRGSDGASVSTASGIRLAVPATTMEAPIVDTMGAGDATLASVLSWILRTGMPTDHQTWRSCLREAMDVAAATCRNAGGALIRPPAKMRLNGSP